MRPLTPPAPRFGCGGDQVCGGRGGDARRVGSDVGQCVVGGVTESGDHWVAMSVNRYPDERVVEGDEVAGRASASDEECGCWSGIEGQSVECLGDEDWGSWAGDSDSELDGLDPGSVEHGFDVGAGVVAAGRSDESHGSDRCRPREYGVWPVAGRVVMEIVIDVVDGQSEELDLETPAGIEDDVPVHGHRLCVAIDPSDVAEFFVGGLGVVTQRKDSQPLGSSAVLDEFPGCDA